ncbi:MAG: hypothetical protein D3914_03700 [Candidatus Electrothrix sp. LOE2]|nr:hypothetical protein [Candidatus Electrothrix sp. LOE2]
MAQEGAFTKIGAIATVIGVIITASTWLGPTPLENKQPVGSDIGDSSNRSSLFDKNSIYTIGSDTFLKVFSDIYIPAYAEILYIQRGKIFLNKEHVDETDCFALLNLTEHSETTRILRSEKFLKITDSSIYGPEDREYRHTYAYLKVDNNDIKSIKCIGKDSSTYVTIGQFRNMIKGIIDVDIPNPKEF